jgi:hypothetical protein
VKGNQTVRYQGLIGAGSLAKHIVVAWLCEAEATNKYSIYAVSHVVSSSLFHKLPLSGGNAVIFALDQQYMLFDVKIEPCRVFVLFFTIISEGPYKHHQFKKKKT